MNVRAIARRRDGKRLPVGQADVSTIIIVVSLCAAVFACFFLIGRAASPRGQAAEVTLPTVGAAVAGIPIRMSSAPAITPAITPAISPRRSAPTAGAGAGGTQVEVAVSPVTTQEPTPTQTETPTETPTPTPAPRPTHRTPSRKPTKPSTNGPGTSFDTSG